VFQEVDRRGPIILQFLYIFEFPSSSYEFWRYLYIGTHGLMAANPAGPWHFPRVRPIMNTPSLVELEASVAVTTFKSRQSSVNRHVVPESLFIKERSIANSAIDLHLRAMLNVMLC
jgi:hypothetical protein